MEGIYKPHNYAKTVGANAIHPYFLAVNEEVIKEAKKHRTQINVFTVDDEEKMKFFLDKKVDGIITNFPDKLYRIMAESISK